MGAPSYNHVSALQPSGFERIPVRHPRALLVLGESPLTIQHERGLWRRALVRGSRASAPRQARHRAGSCRRCSRVELSCSRSAGYLACSLARHRGDES
jgi:hypothetical protein